LDAIALQAKLEILLAPSLGTYTLAGGQVVPAFWAFPPSVPPDRKVTGLEAIFGKQPRRSPPNRHTFGNALVQQTWSLRLVQHNRNIPIPSSVIEAIELEFTEVDSTLLEQTQIAPAQVIYQFRDSCFLRK
jgi:hypothetical protein